MKYLNSYLGLLLLLLFSVPAAAQSPQAFTYQTVVRDASGSPLTTPVVFRMSILADSPNGNVAYQETHDKTPNAFGLVTINVGEQDPAAFAVIDWGATRYFMRTEIDTGDGFAEAGSPELIRSVPYALHAQYGEDADADPANELQQLTRNGDIVTLSDGGSVSIADGDASPTNELQQLSISGNTITLSNGGSITLDESTDSDPTNELQQLTRSGSTVTLSDGGSVSIEDDDANPANELQQISRNGNVVTLSDGGSVNIEDDDANPANELQQLTRTGTTVTLSDGGSVSIEDADANPANELQQLTRDGDMVTLSNGGSVSIADGDASPTNELQQLSISGNTITLSNGGSVTLDEDTDSDPTNELQQLTRSGNTVTLSDGGSVNIEDDDANPANELQQLTRTGNVVTLSDGGSVNIEDDDANPANELQQLTRDGNTVTLSQGGSVSIEDGDADPANELQQLSLTDNVLSLSGGGSVMLEDDDDLSPTNELQNLSISGDRIRISGTNSFVDVRHVWSKVGSYAVYPDRVRIGSAVTGTSDLNIISTFATYNPSGMRLLRATTTSSGAGFFSVAGSNGLENARFTNTSGNGNHGYFSIKDAGGNDEAGIYVNGSGNGIVWGDTKNFRMDHPEDPQKEIWYASVEGPEAAAYARGTGQLQNGEAFISFSEHFQLVANPETMTVQLTPLSADTYGLAVIEKTAEGFRVKELAGGQGNFQFDWEVKAVRKGYEDYQPVREKQNLGADPVEERN